MDLSPFLANYKPANLGFGAPQGGGQAAQPKKKKNFWLDQISTAGGILGGIGGTLISPIAGTVAGGAAGSALGETLENALTHDSLTKNVAKEAALGGVFSVGPIKLAKASLGAASGVRAALGAGEAAAGNIGRDIAEQGLKTSLRGKLESSADKALLSQYGTISSPVMRATRPAETIAKLADIGITKPQDAERIAQAITGGKGILNKTVAKAVGEAGIVPTHNVESVLADSIASNGLSGLGAEKALTKQVEAQLKSLTNGAQPGDILKVMRKLEGQATEYVGKGGTYHLATSADKAKAAVLMDVRNHLEDQLYNAAGANKNIAGLLTPELRQQLVSLHPKSSQWASFVDKNIMNAKDVGALRSAQAPFVKVSKIIDEGANNAITYGGRVGNNFGSGLNFRDKLINAGTELVKNPAARATSTALRGAAQGLDGRVAAPTAKGIAGRLGGLGAVQGLMGQSQPANAQGLEGALTSDTGVPQAGGQVPGLYDSPAGNSDSWDPNDPTAMNPPSANPYSKQNLMADIQRDPKNAEKYVQYYASLEDIFNPESKNKAEAPYSRPTAAQYSQGISGLQAVDRVAQMFGQNPSLASKNALPGQRLPGVGGLVSRAAGTSSYRGAANNILNSIARINTGANMPESERQFYEMTYLPQPGDDQQTVAYKLASLKQFFQPIVSYQGSNTGSLEDALTQGASPYGYN